MLRIIILYVFSGSALLCNAQQLLNVTSSQQINHSFTGGFYGCGASFYDFNNDGWDDITLPNYVSDNMFYINNNGTFQSIDLISEDRNFKSLIWVDFDNDGDSDLSYTEADGEFGIYENTGNLNLVELDLLYTSPENYLTDNLGISWGDYDRDGYLDFYVSRYMDPNSNEYYANLLFKNNGDGTFTEMADPLGVGNGDQQTFIASWFDSDLDGDLDLYLANDRNIYPNALYRNDEGTFTDISQDSETDLTILAMCSTVGDYDNDEDLDIYCSEGFAGNHLMRNDGDNNFTDLYPNSGTETFSFCWGSKWIDLNNNGWKDLFVCSGSPIETYNRFYENNQDGTFDLNNNVLDGFAADSHSAAKGDFNNDGFYDLVISNEAPFNSRLLENSPSEENNSVKITLKGVQSNRDAIGSRITAYIGGRVQTEFTFAGSDYLSQDSQHTIIGLGQDTIIDSLKITWPLGLVEWIYEINASEKLHLLEGEHIDLDISPPGFHSLCNGDSLLISLTENYDTYTWNNGITSNNFYTQEPGEYFATVLVNGFFEVNSDTITVNVGMNPEIISETINSYSCIESMGSISAEILIENDSTYFLEVENLDAASYVYSFTNSYNCSTQVEFIVPSIPQLIMDIATEDVECFGDNSGSVVLDVSGGTPPYVVDLIDDYDPDNLYAGEYFYSLTDANNCLVSDAFMIYTNPEPLINLEVNNAYDETLGSIIISTNIVSPTITINGESTSSVINNLTPGNYEIIVADEYGCETIFNEDILLTDNILEDYAENILVYPTPFNDELHLEKLKKNSTIYIIDSTGKTVYLMNCIESQKTIQTNQLGKGIYHLYVKTDEGDSFSMKLLKL